jgi:lipopolysaccharide assembly outer membrane protein LptD (OstA)
MNKWACIILFTCFSSSTVIGQSPANPKPKDTLTAQAPSVAEGSKLIEFLSAEVYNVKKMDSMDYLIFVGHVKIRQGKTLLYGDSIILNSTLNTLEGFGNVHINDADSVHTYANYLKYIGATKKAFLRKKVRLTDGKGVLTTDSLDYDVNISR